MSPLERLLRLNIQQQRLEHTRQKLLYQHRMKLNRIDALQDKLNVKHDIAFRELEFEMREQYRIRRRVSLEDTFPESGPVDLTDYDFLE